ncbi:Cthe_2314 family HEPN domain-containing protein [Paenibacillus ginsengarvi]|uniref:Cthe_2314 family HEPN domain-containing protein n=1 Tax=Paenibacillus ginsengarvi TaxID=400777 RepID=UPI001F028E23|nr:Cthe_2314 family HEPN domain-containing protein [Paenibacillus ginsengarvi]
MIRIFRTWFDEPKRVDSGSLQKAFAAIADYRKLLTKLIDEQTPQCETYTRYELWARGLANALDELEQSVYCAGRFRESVTHRQEEKMDAEELANYRRHLYFYKNGFIRLFSILDKLGYFMNDLLKLRSERVKRKFSYFTVLRQMQHLHAEPALAKPLQEIKERYQEQLSRLRHKRNMEIHLVNAEMLDDLLHIDACRTDRSYIEDLSANMDDLTQGLEMACLTIEAVFAYAYRRKKT